MSEPKTGICVCGRYPRNRTKLEVAVDQEIISASSSATGRLKLQQAFDVTKMVRVPAVKKRLISIRIPLPMLKNLKQVAGQTHGHYQSLMVHYIREGLQRDGCPCRTRT